jgi:hypothetical protein
MVVFVTIYIYIYRVEAGWNTSTADLRAVEGGRSGTSEELNGSVQRISVRRKEEEKLKKKKKNHSFFPIGRILYLGL